MGRDGSWGGAGIVGGYVWVSGANAPSMSGRNDLPNSVWRKSSGRLLIFGGIVFPTRNYRTVSTLSSQGQPGKRHL